MTGSPGVSWAVFDIGNRPFSQVTKGQAMVKLSELEVWFDFASPYAYLSAMRIDEWTLSAGVNVRWMPFMLGPIFKSQGWETSPFNIYPNKGRYMWRDMQRLCDRYRLVFKPPTVFPQSSLLAARVAVAARNEDWLANYCQKIFQSEFCQNRDIADQDVVAKAVEECGQQPDAWLELASSADIKSALKDRGLEAENRKLFGSPSFVTPDGELFWGDDRLEQAIEWVLKNR